MAVAYDDGDRIADDGRPRDGPEDPRVTGARAVVAQHEVLVLDECGAGDRPRANLAEAGVVPSPFAQRPPVDEDRIVDGPDRLAGQRHDPEHEVTTASDDGAGQELRGAEDDDLAAVDGALEKARLSHEDPVARLEGGRHLRPGHPPRGADDLCGGGGGAPREGPP